MIISFAVQNYRSIYERQELTFLASKYTSFSEALIRHKKAEGGILPLIAIYGANAAGKSNFLSAMKFVASAVRNSQNKWEPNGKLPADPHFFHQEEPCDFECVFILQKESYRFGFSLNSERITKEHLFVGKNLIYRRNENRYRLGPVMKGFEATKRITRSNALFISAAAQNNHPLLKKIQSWFASWIAVTDSRRPEEAFAGLLMGEDGTRPFMIEAISAINPEIINLELGEPSSSGTLVPKVEKNVEMEEALKRWSRINVIHQSADKSRTAKLPLREESKGTRCYLALANHILFTLNFGGVLLLDEADQGLHPALLKTIVALFQTRKTNPNNAQLVFNTHDTSLLAPDVLRPDEVWFVERDSHSHSRIYCMADFEGIRSETKAQRAYLEGRFGAVPFLEDISKVFVKARISSAGAKDA